MRKMRTTIGIVIDTLGSIIIYAVIALAILFMAGQAKHYYDVGYGVFSQQGKDARGTGKVVAFTVEEGEGNRQSSGFHRGRGRQGTQTR